MRKFESSEVSTGNMSGKAGISSLPFDKGYYASGNNGDFGIDFTPMGEPSFKNYKNMKHSKKNIKKKKMKNFEEFIYENVENDTDIDYFEKISNYLKEIRNLESKILDYLSYTENYNPPGFFIKDIYLGLSRDTLIIVTDSNNNSNLNFYIDKKNRNDFNLFLNDPELYKNKEKFNL